MSTLREGRVGVDAWNSVRGEEQSFRGCLPGRAGGRPAPRTPVQFLTRGQYSRSMGPRAAICVPGLGGLSLADSQGAPLHGETSSSGEFPDWIVLYL